MADIIQVNYDELKQVSDRFSQQNERWQQTSQALRSKMDTVLTDGWLGDAANAFSTEMNDLLLPGVERLTKALEGCTQLLTQIGNTMEQADQEIKSLFPS